MGRIEASRKQLVGGKGYKVGMEMDDSTRSPGEKERVAGAFGEHAAKWVV